VKLLQAASTDQESTWTWKFDPQYQQKMDFAEYVNETGLPRLVEQLPLRVGIVYGQDSLIVSRDTQSYMRWRLGEHVSLIPIPGAGHHCFLDQPLAVVSVLRTMFSEWSRSATAGTDGNLLPRLRARASHSDFDGDIDKLTDRLKKEMTAAFGPPKEVTKKARL
jgi:hypothetical protein